MKLKIEEKICQPDPFVIKDGDTYFMYSSHKDGVVLNASKDLHNWEYFGIVYKEKGMWEYWAPCIIKIENKFYIYVSFRENGHDDAHEEHLIVCSSPSPYGPFKFESNLVEPFSIDPHVVKSGDDYFIFYSKNNYEANRAGTYIVVDKLITPIKVEGNPKAVVVPTLDEEIFMKDRFKVGQHWHTIEGAFYFRKGDYHFLMYSGNCYQNVNYFVGYSVAKSSSNNLKEIDFKKYPSDDIYKPFISKDDKEEGTGHNSVLEENNKYYMFYHARDNGILIPGKEQRTARIAEIEIDNDKLILVNRHNKGE